MAVLVVTCPPHQPIEANNESGQRVLACSCGMDFGSPGIAEHRMEFIEHAGISIGIRRFLAFDLVMPSGRTIRVT